MAKARPAAPTNEAFRLARKSFSKIPQVLEVPNLIQTQLDSFDWLQGPGIKELLDESSPISDFTGDRYELRFLDHHFEEPHYTAEECRKKEITFSAPLSVTVQLLIKLTGEFKEQRLFMGDVPKMTVNGTFVINGAERVVVSQLVRSPGAYFTAEIDTDTGRPLASAKLIPYRGAWLEFETNSRGVISVKVDRKRRMAVTTLLRSLGIDSEEEILRPFADVDTNPDLEYMRTTLDRDTQVHNQDEALIEFYRRLRPGEPPSLDNARNLIESLFFNQRRYDLGRVGRYKLNRKLGVGLPPNQRTLLLDDILAILRRVIAINNRQETADDIDHLGNRRVRAVGELIQNQLRVGMLRMERVVRERMTIIDPEQATPSALVNIRPVVAAVREFFGGSQLSQFMDQTNPLAELTHKRRLSALGPGGLSRERAGFDVRDVHHSHYGRICPIETPEGPNIGLLGSLATYARTNEYGFIETPYRRIRTGISSDAPDLVGRTLTADVLDDDGKIIARKGRKISTGLDKKLKTLTPRVLAVKSFVSEETNDLVHLDADDEERYVIAQANSPLYVQSEFSEPRLEVRRGEEFTTEVPEQVDYMDISPMQTVSVSTSLIPFLEHDDANRALMGSNMQRQAVPLLRPESPLVGTGMEARVAQDSGQVVLSRVSGIVASVVGDEVIIVDGKKKRHSHSLLKFQRSNQGTCINQRPIVSKGQHVEVGTPLADSSSTQGGELALGQTVLVAFMSWDGYNYEDAIIINERLVKEDKFTSIHIEKHDSEARDTKLGPEEITSDIPNVGEESLQNLDENGIIRLGAEVEPGDILVGKITPKGETELSAEEKLLRAIFGEKARDVKDTSLRVKHGERGKVIDVKIVTRDQKDELPPGVNKLVRVWVAQTSKLATGDKMAGRHGNKGVIARILPEEDMPYLSDGTPVDIILNPIGVPSRMNLGQVLETHLGWAAKILGFKVASPVFDGVPDVTIEDNLARAWILQRSGSVWDEKGIGYGPVNWALVREWLEERSLKLEPLFDENQEGIARIACLRLWLEENNKLIEGLSDAEVEHEARRLNHEEQLAAPTWGKEILHDGRTGDAFDQPVAVGQIYMLKLNHLVEDKVHARSTGPYSLITQQPLGGKAQFGGQRFGEMEVWALEAYSAAHNLQEMLTVKSDDVVGRLKTYESMVKGDDIIQPGVPESFQVLLKELQSLGLMMELMHEGGSVDRELPTEADLASDQDTLIWPGLLVGDAVVVDETDDTVAVADEIAVTDDAVVVDETDDTVAVADEIAATDDTSDSEGSE